MHTENHILPFDDGGEHLSKKEFVHLFLSHGTSQSPINTNVSPCLLQQWECPLLRCSLIRLSHLLTVFNGEG